MDFAGYTSLETATWWVAVTLMFAGIPFALFNVLRPIKSIGVRSRSAAAGLLALTLFGSCASLTAVPLDVNVLGRLRESREGASDPAERRRLDLAIAAVEQRMREAKARSRRSAPTPEEQAEQAAREARAIGEQLAKDTAAKERAERRAASARESAARDACRDSVVASARYPSEVDFAWFDFHYDEVRDGSGAEPSTSAGRSC